MNTKNINLLAMVLMIFVLICCEEDNENIQMTLSGQMTSHSACKSDLKSAVQIAETPDSLSCVDYSFDKENNKLTLKHINAAFNCCPDSIYCEIELKGDTIVIQEFEKIAQCNCNCLYDLEIEIDGVIQDSYQIKLLEPYVDEKNPFTFSINLNKDLQGTSCVTRKTYPWGMNSLNE